MNGSPHLDVRTAPVNIVQGCGLFSTRSIAMKPIVYPTLLCPFHAALNSHATEAQQATVAWARRFHLLERDASYRRLHRLQYGMLMARAYPSAAPETLQIVTDWSTWLFLLDDQCDEAGLGHNPEQLARFHTQLLDVLNGVPPTQAMPPLAHGLWNLRTRILSYAPEGWFRRFSSTVKQYFAANVWEATNRRLNQIPDAASYCAMRLDTSAVYPCLLLIELAEELDLPSAAYDHPVVQRLATMTNNVISWANDIVSLEKELRQGDVHNLALILSQEQKLSLQAAVERVAKLHDAEVSAFIALSQRLPSFTPTVDADLQRYVSGMRFWMRANLDWSLDTVRYRSVPAIPAEPVFA
jgi:5-epi-alpha-selinene synthase